MKLEFTPGELYEMSDAVNAALKRYLESGDPEFHEAMQGSVSNLLRASQKLFDTIVGGPRPDWLLQHAARAAALRAKQQRDPAARDAVLKASGSLDYRAQQDGIRDFV